LGGDTNLQSWGRGGRRGSEMVPFERAKVSSYRLPILTFSLSLCVSEILPLLCSRTPFSHPTSPLRSPIFPCSPVSRWIASGLRRAKVLGKLFVQLVSKIANLCYPDPPTLRTDRQTDGLKDGRTDDMQSQYRAVKSNKTECRPNVLVYFFAIKSVNCALEADGNVSQCCTVLSPFIILLPFETSVNFTKAKKYRKINNSSKKQTNAIRWIASHPKGLSALFYFPFIIYYHYSTVVKLRYVHPSIHPSLFAQKFQHDTM